jgi:hypothetical protein
MQMQPMLGLAVRVTLQALRGSAVTPLRLISW